MMAEDDVGGSMLQARSPFRAHAKNQTISLPPPSRQGRLFPPCRGSLVEPMLIVRRVLREQIVILHRRLLAIVRDDEVCRRLMTVVCTENLNSNVMVMKSAKDGVQFDVSGPLNRARDRRIFIQ
jgi:transposase